MPSTRAACGEVWTSVRFDPVRQSDMTKSSLSERPSSTGHRPRRHITAARQAPRQAPRRGERALVGAGWQSHFVEIYARVILLAAWWSLFRLAVHHARPLERFDEAFAVLNLPAGPSLFSAALLLLMCGAVRRRIRAAWLLLIAFQFIAAGYLLLTVSGAVVFGERLGPVEQSAATATAVNAAVTLILVALLLACRSTFTCRMREGGRWRALAMLCGGLAISLATSIILTVSSPHTLRGTPHQVQWAVRAVFGVLPDRTDIGWAHQQGHRWVASLAGLLSGVALLAAALVFLRSTRPKTALSAQDEFDIRTLLLIHGQRDSLGYFATRRDKSALFTAARDAAVTYRVLANVSLVSADPVGPRSRWPDAVAAWLRETREHGWYPAVLSASEEGAKAYVAGGLKAIPMGDEAIIESDRFTLDGPEMQPVRRAARRIRRLGYTITVHRHAELSAAQLAELAHYAGAWRVDQTERGFSMALGRLGDPLDGRSVAVLAHDANGRLRGFLSLAPWGPNGLSLDLMRRDRTSDNGLNEAMVATLVRTARDELGVTRISLNFAMFRGVFNAAERVGAGPLVRLTGRFMRFASRFWQIESLYRANARYQPRWQTRYLCYDSPLTLTRVAIAAGAAEGFLPLLASRGIPPRRDDTVHYDGACMPLLDAVQARTEALRQVPVGMRRPSQQQQVRLHKIELLREQGIDPYPVSVPRTCAVAELRTRFDGLRSAARTGCTVAVVGRIRALRDLGGLMFLVLQEEYATVQAILDRHAVGAAQHELAHRFLDIGDLVGVTGEVVASRRGELSVQVHRWELAAKCLTPVPKLAPATPFRPAARLRHVELITDAGAGRLLELRSAAVRELRAAFARRDFIEVETPMLQAVHGGANARPFVTHMNAYDMPLYLRIAPELHLKRLCVGGLQRIFELNRNFRNEGVDDTHNPEFTSLEAYQAYADYHAMRQLTRQLVLEVATAVHGAPIAVRRQLGARVVEVDLSGPWRALTVHDAVSRACGSTVTPDTPLAELIALCRASAVPVGKEPTPGGLVVKLYEQLVEATTVEPTFYLDFPVEAAPLTRRHRTDPRLAERWDLVAYGQEIGTAYSELTDPIDQRRRLVEQSLRRAAGDLEAMQVDEDFLDTLGYAMPPTGGLGIGVDRLLMMLTGVPIRETLAFPFAGRGELRDARPSQTASATPGAPLGTPVFTRNGRSPAGKASGVDRSVP